MGLSLPPDAACDWSNYLSSNTQNAARRIYMAIEPCIASCHSHGHRHKAQSKVEKKCKTAGKRSARAPTLQRSDRIGELEEAAQ